MNDDLGCRESAVLELALFALGGCLLSHLSILLFSLSIIWSVYYITSLSAATDSRMDDVECIL